MSAFYREHGYLDSFLTLQSSHTLPTRGSRLDICTCFLRHVNQGEITTRPLQCSTSTHSIRYTKVSTARSHTPNDSREAPSCAVAVPVASFSLVVHPHSTQRRSHAEVSKLVGQVVPIIDLWLHCFYMRGHHQIRSLTDLGGISIYQPSLVHPAPATLSNRPS